MERGVVPASETGLDVIRQKQHEEHLGTIRKAIHHVEQMMKQENSQGIAIQLDQAMLQMMLAKMEVAEFYSPPRVAQMPREIGLSAGWSLDLTTNDAGGRAWDFNNLTMRNRAIRKVLTDKPLLLIGSLMCIADSTMNNIDSSRMSAEEVAVRMQYARKHMEFSVNLYKIQAEAGRYFLQEHPHSASSWKEGCMNSPMEMAGMVRVTGDQCMYGFRAKNREHMGPAQKRTGFLTNSTRIAQQLIRRCPIKIGYMVHNHVRLECGRTRNAQVYPRELCRAVCVGLQNHIKADEAGRCLFPESSNDGADSRELMNTIK